MISASDFVRLPYPADLTEGGIACICRSLPHRYLRAGKFSFEDLRRMSAEVAVELAFRRYLSNQEVDFEVREAAPFTQPDRYDVILNGHCCEIRTLLVTYRPQIQAIHANPGLLLHALAWVPFEQLYNQARRENDIYLFAFSTGLIAASLSDLQKALAADQPAYLIHGMKKTWACPRIWMPLGCLTIRSEAREPLELEFGGQDAERDFLGCSLSLPPLTQLPLQADFYSLSYIHSGSKPTGRLELHSPTRQESYPIPSTGWGNIWVYGREILIAGWIVHSEFRRRANLVREGSRVLGLERTDTKGLAVPVSDLQPFSKLLARSTAS